MGAQLDFCAGKQCLGHGIAGQAESLRFGHWVEAPHVDDMFSVKNGEARVGKGFAHNLEPRCRICRSIRRWHDHAENALRRARHWRREHARRWVTLGRASDEEAVFRQMDVGGLTEEALAAKLVAAIGEPCPGLCAHEEDGVIVFHTIESVAKCHIDVKSPLEPFTLENIGILCESCNPAKGDTPWATFMYQRRVALHVWQKAIDNPSLRGSEQLSFL